MRVEVREVEPCKRELVVEAPEDVVQAAWEAAARRVQQSASLPGFRRGKVPRNLVRSRFGDEVRQAVAERLIPEIYREALDETGLRAVDEPDLRDLQLEEGQPLRFTAVVEIKPTLAVDDYRGVPVRHSPTPFGPADVDGALAALAEQRATLATVTRPARVGDFVLVDYTLQPEGGEPRHEPGYGFEVGSGRVLPELDEAVIGLEAGAERQLSVRFPAQHPNEALRGRSGALSFRVVEVKEKEVPPLDDDLARSLGSHETLGELRATIETRLRAQRERQDRHRLEEAVVDALLERHPFLVPESLVLREVTHRIGRAREQVRREGVDPDRLPWDYEKLATELRPDATRSVRRALLLEAIADREGLTADDAAVDQEIARLAEAAGRAPAAVRASLERGDDLVGLRLALREAKTLRFLTEHAEVRPAE